MAPGEYVNAGNEVVWFSSTYFGVSNNSAITWTSFDESVGGEYWYKPPVDPDMEMDEGL